MSSVPVDVHHEKFDILLSKLRLRMLPMDEAREFLSLLGEESQHAVKDNNREYENILEGLTRVVKSYLAGHVNLYESNTDVLKRLNFSNK